MKKPLVIILCLISAIIGAFLFRYINNSDNKMNDKWLVLDNIATSGDNSGLFFLEEALFSDITPPKIKKMSGKVKFIDDKDGLYAVGYILQVDVDKLDVSKIPDKYKKEENKGHFITLPLSEVYYSCKIYLTLYDKDGFKIVALEGPEQSIESGKINTLQEKSVTTVNKDTALKTKSVKLKLTLLKCINCS